MNRKLGYYTVGDLEFDSKVHACIVATKALSHIQRPVHPMSTVDWHFNDETFGAYDWTKEPPLSLDYYYEQRARQLRQDYDYVILSYSGGADSHNMLSAFLRQNLHIDEIICTNLEQAVSDYSTVDPNVKDAKYAYASEYRLQTLPRLAELRNLLPLTKFSIYDMSEQVFDMYRKSKDGSWILNVREEINPVDAARYNYLRIPKFQNSLDRGKKTCIVSGVDKPKVLIHYPTLNVVTRFTDRLTNITPIGEFMKEYTNVTIEYFYWAPECTDLLCKQAHAVKRWLEMNPKLRNFFVFDAPPNVYPSSPLSRSVNERILRSVIYTTWNPTWFQANKGMYDWLSEFDSWFFAKHKDTPEHAVWKEGVKHMIARAEPFVMRDKGFADGLMTFYKDYTIGPLA